MRVLIIEAARREKSSADLSGLRQVNPAWLEINHRKEDDSEIHLRQQLLYFKNFKLFSLSRNEITIEHHSKKGFSGANLKSI